MTIDCPERDFPDIIEREPQGIRRNGRRSALDPEIYRVNTERKTPPALSEFGVVLTVAERGRRSSRLSGSSPETYPEMRHEQKWRILSIVEIDGYQLSIPPWKQGTFFVLAAKFTILSRSARGRSTSLASLEASPEPGEFSIQAPLRIL
jgi:hypothetical protein